jgi:lipid-A-disaccharide synthase
LETALLNVPQVVVYKANPLSYSIAKKVIKVDHISLVNLILDKPLVKELIQSKATEESVSEELELLMTDVSRRREVLNGYQQLKTLLGEGSASHNAARKIKDTFEARRL